MSEILEVKICRCSHSPYDHIHNRYICKEKNCECREYDEYSKLLQIDVEPPPQRKWRAGKNSA